VEGGFRNYPSTTSALEGEKEGELFFEKDGMEEVSRWKGPGGK